MGLGGRVLFLMCARRERLCLNLMRRYLSQRSDESVLGHGLLVNQAPSLPSVLPVGDDVTTL